MLRPSCATAPFLALVLLVGALPAQGQAEKPDQAADELLGAGKMEEALRRLDEVIAGRPGVSVLHWQRAFTKGQLGDVEGGLRDADKAIELDATNFRAWLERGYLKGKAGRYQDAIADYDRAIELAPKNPFGFGDRGDARQSLGDFEGAIADYDQAIRLAPRFGAAFYNRARCRHELGQLLPARSDFLQAVRFVPPQAQVFEECASVEADGGMWRTALARAAKAVELAPTDWALRARRGRLAWRGGLAEQGLDDLRAAAGQQQDAVAAADALFSLGCVHLCLGDAKAAAADFARIAGLDVAGAKPFARLLRWCAERRLDAAAADAALAVALTDPGLTPEQRELVLLCSRGEGDSEALPLPGREPDAACPLLFFSGWRAECSGRRAEALRKFVRCANTGRSHWLQWQLAVDHVRQWSQAAPLPVGFGVELQAAADGAGLVVAKVTPGLAGDWQGLTAGDVVTALNHEPATLARWQEIGTRLQVGLPVWVTRRREGGSERLRLHAGLEPR